MAAWLTRGTVAAQLGISIASVRRLETSGGLRPSVGDDGVHRFDPAEVARAAAERGARPRANAAPGELAAQAFEMFAEGKRPRDAVIALRIVPERAREWFRAFAEDDLILPGVVVAELGGMGVGRRRERLEPEAIVATIKTLRGHVRRLEEVLGELNRDPCAAAEKLRRMDADSPDDDET